MSSGFEDQAKIDKLPKEGVHCFPASGKQVTSRRVITIILMIAFAALAAYGFVKGGTPLYAGIVSCIVILISLLVFIQSFLIAKFRVAIDYNEKKVLLKYRFSNIEIPFENFDGRDGTPDKAETLIDNNFNQGEKTFYLILDNVFEDACFQTSTKDLASREDFFKLKEEAFAIADAYGARNSEDKVKFWNEEKTETKKDLGDDELEKIVNEAKAETGEVEEVAAEVEEIAEETVEAAEAASDDNKEE